MSKENSKPENTYSLLDFIPIEKLQEIQDAFAKANGVASTITEIDGTPITKPSNHSQVCTMIRATEVGMSRCIESGEHLGLEAAKQMIPIHKMCLSCGFTDASAPIVVNGQHIANWLIGQNNVRDVDEKKIREYSKEIGADEEKMAIAFIEMPKIPIAHFERILEFLWLMANEISNMGYINLKQRKQTQELEKIKAQLENHQLKLEEIVVERTAKLVQLNRKLTDEIDHKDELQKLQTRLVAAIENVSESIVITDTDPKIIYTNPAFEKSTGYSKEEAKGRSLVELNLEFHDSKFFNDISRTIQKGEVWKGRIKNKNRQGEIFTEDVTVSPVKDQEGNITHYVAIKRNITQQLKIEGQLLQMSKMEAIGTLAAGIAHEINTPIQYVTSNTIFLKEVFEDFTALNKLYRELCTSAIKNDLLVEQTTLITAKEDEVDLDYIIEETGQALDGALEGLDRITTVVRAMKEFSHPGGKEKEEEDLNRIIDSTVTVSSNEWKMCADINLELDGLLPRVSMYSSQIKQVVLNLIVNAAHAISAKNDGKKGVITITTGSEDKNARVVIQDNGIGIPEEIIKKVFDPFFTTKPVGKGTGQGLALVHSVVVEAHGGTLTVNSTPGKGAEFIFTLPIK